MPRGGCWCPQPGALLLLAVTGESAAIATGAPPSRWYPELALLWCLLAAVSSMVSISLAARGSTTPHPRVLLVSFGALVLACLIWARDLVAGSQTPERSLFLLAGTLAVVTAGAWLNRSVFGGGCVSPDLGCPGEIILVLAQQVVNGHWVIAFTELGGPA
jgi:hypothetical protein